MNYKNLENKIADEVLSDDERKISVLLGGLKRIDAPKDFDFRVKARVAAQAAPNFRHPQFMPVLRYALPLVLMLFVAAAVFKNFYFGNVEDAPQIAENQSQTSVAENIQTNQASAPVAAAPPQKPEIVSAPSPNETRDSAAKVVENVSTRGGAAGEKIKNIRAPSDTDSSVVAVKSVKKPTLAILPKEIDAAEAVGGSRTSASKSSAVIAPPGINPNQTVKILPNAENLKSLTVAEVLSQLGIDAFFTNANWTVKSVRLNSLAERSGVRANDIVEAIDGERLTDKPLKNKFVEGKKLSVARGAEKIEITLNGQPK